MASSRGRCSSSSFVRKAGPSPALPSAVVRQGRHATFLVSSGFSDLDQIIGGGFPLGSLIMVIEDVNAPHHMLLLRYFMAQGLLHGQPLLFASSVSSPDAFLGTLPGVAKEVPDHAKTSQGEESLRIAWQYRKYLDEQQSLEDRRKRQEVSMSQSQGISQEYCTTFDLKKPAARLMLSSGKVECVNLCAGTTLTELQEKCKKFFSLLSRPAEGIQQIGRIALQSLCAPQGMHFYKAIEWPKGGRDTPVGMQGAGRAGLWCFLLHMWAQEAARRLICRISLMIAAARITKERNLKICHQKFAGN